MPSRRFFSESRHPDPAANPEQRKAQRAETTKPLLATLKAKTSLELAMAMVEAVRDARLDIPTIQLLDSIVTESGLSRNLIELRLLQQLAGRASKLRRDEWDDELTKKILEHRGACRESEQSALGVPLAARAARSSGRPAARGRGAVAPAIVGICVRPSA